MNELLSLGLGVLSYAFILLFIFNLLKIDYYNPIVKGFINIYKPISKISFFSNQLYTIFIIAVLLRFSNFSHGELMSFGAMSSILLTLLFKDLRITTGILPTAIIILPIAIIITIIYCLVIDKLVFKFYRQQKSKSVITLIVSIGVMFFSSNNFALST